MTMMRRLCVLILRLCHVISSVCILDRVVVTCHRMGDRVVLDKFHVSKGKVSLL